MKTKIEVYEAEAYGKKVYFLNKLTQANGKGKKYGARKEILVSRDIKEVCDAIEEVFA